MPSGDYPRTLPALFRQACQAHGDQPAVSDAEQTLTYRELEVHSDHLATALQERGVTRGDRVAVLVPNQVAVPVIDVAILKAGAVRLPLNTMQSRDELTYVFDDAAVTAIVCGHDQVADVTEIAAGVDVRIVVGGSAPGFDQYDELVSNTGGGNSQFRNASLEQLEPDDIAGHYYTGGTTGRPKGVLYSHRCLFDSLLAHLAEFGFDDRDVGVLAPPLSHSAGTFLWANLLAGGHVHVQSGFDPETILAAIDAEDASWTFLVPTMLYRILDSDGLEDARAQGGLDSLERVLYGAAPMQPDRLREAIDRIGPVFEQFYGQTEVPNLITTLSRADHQRAIETDDHELLASAGTPCLRSRVRIVDEDGEDRPPGEVGEVVVTAPYMFDGYHESPEATNATLRDGWVWTGDIGSIDGDGYLQLLDRKSDVIVTGGLNVYSAEVERIVSEHPAVAEVLVVGIPSDDWGEAVHAVIVPDSEATVTTDEIVEFAGNRLSSYKKPKSVEFVDELPTTPLGKLDRSRLRDRYWEDTDRNVG